LKTITLARRDYLAKGDLTEARTWRAVRKDGTVFTFTNNDVDLTKNSERYVARTGFNASAVSNTASLAVDNMEVSGFLHGASITEVDISAGRWDAATIFVADVNFRNVAQGQTIVAVGTVGNISAGRLSFTVECRGHSQLLSQNIGRSVTPYCDADVFDARCGKDPTPYIVTGSVTGGNTDMKHFSDSTRHEADRWFDFGKVTWLAGENAGLSQEIKKQTGSAFVLQLRMPFPIDIGDTYTMLPGCNKLLNRGAIGDAITGACNSNNLPPDTFTAPGMAQPSGFFNNAILTWLSGQNTGVVVHISAYVSDRIQGTFTLSYPMTGGINIGDRFTLAPDPNVVATFAGTPDGDCKIKYNNANYFRGFPYVPGLNRTVGEGNAPA